MELNLAAWLDYIETIHPSNWELGLDRIGRVADRLELRQPAPTSVIVAGTNGKGSTCVCLEQVLLAAGLTVGCTLSPHVHVFNERVRVNGRELDDGGLCEAFQIIEAGRGDIQLTYFEFTSLAALYCFKRAAVDVAVLEVGLGGRLDAFNIVDGDIAVITSIGIDHTDYLGDTRERIGTEKAGVLRPGQQVMLGPDMPASVLEPALGLARSCLRIGHEIDFGWRGTGWWRLNLNGRILDNLPAGRPAHRQLRAGGGRGERGLSRRRRGRARGYRPSLDAGTLRGDCCQGPALDSGCRAQSPGRRIPARRTGPEISRCACARSAGNSSGQGRGRCF